MSDDDKGQIWVTGVQERNHAKHWAILNAERMRHSVVIIASPNGNAEAHLGWLRGFAARRPLTFAVLIAVLAAVAARVA